MFEAIKKGFFASIGAAVVTRDKIQEIANRLVEEGKITPKEADELTQELYDLGNKEWEEIESDFQEFMKQKAEKLNLCSREDLLQLQERLEVLERRFSELEFS